MLISNVLFIASVPIFYLFEFFVFLLTTTITFYRITCNIFKNFDSGKKLERFSYISALFYIFNPATIFMSSLYTESSFSFCLLTALYFYQKSQLLFAALFFAFGTFIRSNGIITIGFFLYHVLKYTIWNFHSQTLLQRIKLLCTQLICMAIVALPYILFQYYGYLLYCTARNENFVSREYLETNHPWCLATIPHLYNYVQSKYWNVGLFKYYTMNQVPNFVLAFPVVCNIVFCFSTF